MQVLSNIRVPIIAPIMMLAIKDLNHICEVVPPVRIFAFVTRVSTLYMYMCVLTNNMCVYRYMYVQPVCTSEVRGLCL